MNNIYLEKRDVFNYPNSELYFSPSIKYPEYPFEVISQEINEVYDMVRASFFGMEMDIDNYGTEKWNPLGEVIKEGDVVVVKPNLVRHCKSVEQYECTLTHPSLIRAVIDYCIIAKAGRIILGDAPVQGAEMEKIMVENHYDKLIQYYKNNKVEIEFVDFRDLIVKSEHGLTKVIKEKGSDSTAFFSISLGEESKHYDKTSKKEYETCGYLNDEINMLHNGSRHDYIIAREIIEADVIINMPKPKTHRFAGITAAQKNFIGACSDKECLPHFQAGSPCVGGDETNKNTLMARMIAKTYRQYLYADKNNKAFSAQFFHIIYRLLYELKGENLYHHGAWYGNDTIWRTIIDVNKVILFSNKQGVFDISHGIQRKILTIGDLIVAGEKDGPLQPSPHPLGMVLISDNSAIFDYVFCKIIGFDEKLIPAVHHTIRNTKLSMPKWDEVCLMSNVEDYNNIPIIDLDFGSLYRLEPHPFWKKIL